VKADEQEDGEIENREGPTAPSSEEQTVAPKEKSRTPSRKSERQQAAKANPTPISPSSTAEARPTTQAIINRISGDATMLMSRGLAATIVSQIQSLVEQYKTATNDQQRHAIRRHLQGLHKEMVSSIKEEVEKRYGPQDGTNESLLNDLRAGKSMKTAEDDGLPLIKEGSNAIGRFLKRQLLKMRPGNETVSHRIDISNSIDKAEVSLKGMMDVLHDTIDIEKLQAGIQELKTILGEMAPSLKVILELYERGLYSDPKTREKFRGRTQSITGDPNIDVLMRRRIREDLRRGML
jgi:hypothetical protein